MKQLNSATLDIFDALSIDVEASFTKGLPSFSIVGLASSSIQEARDRVKSALLSNEFKFPPLKITINLSPSDINKNGTHIDLPIALLIVLYNDKINLRDFYVFGELGLDGKLKDTSAIFPLVLSLAQQQCVKKILVPASSAKKLSLIPQIEVYSVENLYEAIEFVKTEDKTKYKYDKYRFEHEFIEINSSRYYYTMDYKLDFKDVKGQVIAKRAAMISAAGNHNIIFEGSPGCGKSMISKRLPYIMAPMSLEELLEKAKLDALDLKEPSFIPVRNFRSPHHSSTKASIFGGGSRMAKVGEVALANNGVLFFDELPHFSKSVLEAMREPLEDHKLLVSRVNSKTEYSTKFTFVSALNPCPCGNLLSDIKECRCSDIDIKKYKNRLSEPFLDRIDLYIVMNEVTKDDIAEVSSNELHNKVLKAFEKQKMRKQKELNGKLSDEEIRKFCILDDSAQEVLDRAISSFNLSFRGINKILKVSRTIADIDDSELIEKKHILEAISFRKR